MENDKNRFFFFHNIILPYDFLASYIQKYLSLTRNKTHKKNLLSCCIDFIIYEKGWKVRSFVSTENDNQGIQKKKIYKNIHFNFSEEKNQNRYDILERSEFLFAILHHHV